MVTLHQIIEGLYRRPEHAVAWLELVRDLAAPINVKAPALEFSERWAEPKDMLVLAALQGFVKGADFLDRAFAQGDRFLLLERSERICAFAWVTFRDYRLDLLQTLRLAPGVAYLVYIFVFPRFQGKGVGYFLLGRLMQHLRETGCHTLVSGMYEDWKISLGLHRKSGFRIRRKFLKRRLLRFIPCPPKVIEVKE
jgi:GNAT superfamily N-acetyltransferase